ncbi:MAG: geranylgeranylglyceryl/heptaprenylglyceryl phosphate synthase [Bacteroidales bacterium]
MKILDLMAVTGKKKFAVLVDPDKLNKETTREFSTLCNQAGVDFLFAGGSLVMHHRMDEMLDQLKANTSIPVIIFPGNSMQISNRADGILLLSLISGRNPEMLIGRHVEAAPVLKKSGLQIIPTGYMLIESGSMTTALYISNSSPIPRNKPDVAACTAMAGEMLGLRAIYLDAGSGAEQPVTPGMIRAVKDHISVPLIVGGGIRTPRQCEDACFAGADIVVVGNAIEANPGLIGEMSAAVHQ